MKNVTIITDSIADLNLSILMEEIPLGNFLDYKCWVECYKLDYVSYLDYSWYTGQYRGLMKVVLSWSCGYKLYFILNIKIL